jgi:hypothetical protein
MKMFALACLGLASLSSAAQTLKTYQSADGVFRFHYSRILIDCSPLLATGKAEAAVMDACMSQGAICEDGAEGGKTIVCLGFPKDRFPDKTEFVAATFFVAEAPALKTEPACWKKSPDWLVTGTRTAVLHGVRFAVFDIADNWTGGGQSGPIYRTFHNGKCYELGQQTAMARRSGDDDGGAVQRFTPQDAQQVSDTMKAALRSFQFVK